MEKKKDVKFGIKKYGIYYLMFIPCAGLLIMFSYVPMAGIILSFKDFYPKLGIFDSRSDKANFICATLIYNKIFFMVCQAFCHAFRAFFTKKFLSSFFFFEKPQS